MPEIWKDIKDFEGKYQISNLGRVKSLARARRPEDTIMKLSLDKGYHRVNLINHQFKKKRFNVHRLVALAFLPNPENKSEVNHKNAIKIDNRAINLEWMTRKENQNHAKEAGLIASGEKNGFFKGKIQCFDSDGKLVHEFKGMKEIRDAGFTSQHVYKCVCGTRATHKNCTFKRIAEPRTSRLLK